ncbi:MAG: RDD family protein [Chitinophagaceae bacterium]|nr:RDD family protein [Chitinophagaceae bacterium]MBK8312314.1 RDD family protein [Chitinophagaceae bacterium]MBK8607509.1 RDD family protein [Chitinophagaceae bacterium]MBP6477359.1 RDD family protein [Chitinophagaceae bacterium]MBP7108426.1 RDD family protein [Chitinophagaceae bacterium]
MAVIKVPTNFNIEVDFEVPEFYRRLLSLFIDVLIEYFYLRIAGEIFSSIERSGGWGRDSQYNMQAIGLLLFLPILLYHPIMEITMNGQSLGKKIMGIRVVNEIGGRPGISQFLIRWLLRVSDLWIAILLFIVLSNPNFLENAESTFMVLAGLAFLITDIVLVVSSKKGQRIGDILAKTILIRINTKGNIEDTVFIDVADSYVPSYPQIMQLSDKDINAIKSILETSRKKNDYNMAESACYKIKSHLKIESTLPPFDLLDTLLKDYNYLSTK